MNRPTYFFVTLAIIVVILFGRSGFSGDLKNLLSDGGFEEKGEAGLPLGWRIMPEREGKGEAVLDKKSVHSGRYSLKLTPNRKNTVDGFGVFMKLNPKEVQGKEVTISGYVKLEGMGENPAGMLFKTDRDNWLVFPQAVQNEFFFFSKTFSVINSISEATLFYIAGGTKGSVWLDDLSVTINHGSSFQKRSAKKIMPTYDDPFIDRINTPGWQDSAFISPDGRELYFAYAPYTQKVLMNIVLGRIEEKDVKVKGPIRPGTHDTTAIGTYKAVRNNDGTWGKPVNLNINSSYQLYAAKLSFDGSELYYVIRDHPKGYGTGDIFVSRKQAEGRWSDPENLGQNINTERNEDTPFLSADGKDLYFARNRGDALGWEIFVSHRINGKWTVAEKLSPPINESRPETTANHQAFITADGKEFYFTRIQKLFRSTKQSDGKWGKPVEVFPQLPVSGHASVTADGRYLYFLTVKDRESLERQNWSIWYSERRRDGGWGNPKPVD